MSHIENSDVQLVAIDKISILNPRDRNRTRFLEIVDSIRAVGLKRPITVSRCTAEGSSEYNLVCGQGRLEAFRELGQTEIPAIVLDLSEKECFVHSLVENVARRRHSPLELVRGVGALAEAGYKTQDIASKTGLSCEYVSGITQLIESGEERLITGVEQGQIPIYIALAIASAPEVDVQKALTEAYETKKLRGRKLKAALSLIKTRTRQGKKLSNSYTRNTKSLTAKKIVRAYKDEVKRQRELIQKVAVTERRLTIIVQALKQLLEDERFVLLLRAEGLDNLPKFIADQITPEQHHDATG